MGMVVEDDGGAVGVYRTARVQLRVTVGQADRLYGLLRDAGDVWAALVDLNVDRWQRQAAPEVNFQGLCRELTGVDVGGLSRHCAEAVLRRYTDAWHETARRRKRGEQARYPRRKRAANAAHRRRVRQAHHEAAKQVVEWAVTNRIGTIVVGDLGTILAAPAGSAHRWRTRQWRHGHLLAVLRDKAAAAGIDVAVVDERGTSSTCPACQHRHKPRGRRFVCPACGLTGHRDLVGAANIARRAPGGEPDAPASDVTTVLPTVVKHRRAGRHLPGVTGTRRDRRVTSGTPTGDNARSCPGLGRPYPQGSRTHRTPQRTWIAATVRGQPPALKLRQTTSPQARRVSSSARLRRN